MQRITVQEGKRTFDVQMPENFDMGKIFIEPTPINTTELVAIRTKVKDKLAMMLDGVANVTIAVNNFIKMLEDARVSENGDHISITFVDKNYIELNVHRCMKLDDGTYGCRIMVSVTFMYLESTKDWEVKYIAYDRDGNTESLITDYFEEGEETVDTLKTLIKSVCTLGKA